MSKKKLKVFHGLVNYGTQAGLFAKELRNNGIEALSVSYPDNFKRFIDIELLHGGSILQKILKHTWNWLRRFYWFFRFNTFHFYFGTTLFPFQCDLPLYKIFGKKVLMEYLGYDVQLYKYSLDKYEITNVKYYKSHEISLTADYKKKKRLKFETKYLDKQFVCAPYLSEFVTGSNVLPLGIDLSEYSFSPKENLNSEIVIMHAPTSKDNKGSSFILNALNKLIKDGFNIRIMLVENVPHKELKERYKDCDIFIDQVLSGWYGTAAIEAMAIGRPVICYYREEYFQYINYGKKIPIINANCNNIYEVLKDLLCSKQNLQDIGLKSRKFVEDVHDIKKITERLIKEYNSLFYA